MFIWHLKSNTNYVHYYLVWCTRTHTSISWGDTLLVHCGIICTDFPIYWLKHTSSKFISSYELINCLPNSVAMPRKRVFVRRWWSHARLTSNEQTLRVCSLLAVGYSGSRGQRAKDLELKTSSFSPNISYEWWLNLVFSFVPS